MIHMKVLKMEETKQVLNMQDVISAIEEVYRAQSADDAVIWPLITEIFEEEKAEMDIKIGRAHV